MSRRHVGSTEGAVLVSPFRNTLPTTAVVFIAFEGQPGYFKMALNVVLLLGAALSSPLYLKHPQGPDADVTPKPEQGT